MIRITLGKSQSKESSILGFNLEREKLEELIYYFKMDTSKVFYHGVIGNNHKVIDYYKDTMRISSDMYYDCSYRGLYNTVKSNLEIAKNTLSDDEICAIIENISCGSIEGDHMDILKLILELLCDYPYEDIYDKVIECDNLDAYELLHDSGFKIENMAPEYVDELYLIAYENRSKKTMKRMIEEIDRFIENIGYFDSDFADEIIDYVNYPMYEKIDYMRGHHIEKCYDIIGYLMEKAML